MATIVGVYLRHTTRRKGGKKRLYWQLVRSLRRGLRKEGGRPPFTTSMLRDILSAYGMIQQSPSRHIGPLPNIKEAVGARNADRYASPWLIAKMAPAKYEARLWRNAAESRNMYGLPTKMTFMKNNSQQEIRARLVSDALGSLRIENMGPSQALKQGLESYVAGRKSIAELLGEVKRRHVTLRRA